MIKVDGKRIDQLINRVGELVVSTANFQQWISEYKDPNAQESLLSVLRILTEVREISLKLRMVPIGDLFQKYERVLRDLGKELGKKVKLHMNGKETELDRNIIELLGDPLTHILRNAMDHGLETPEERIQNGKPEEGNIYLSAFQEAGTVVITVSDDGRGIQRKKVWQKALEKGLVSGDEPKSPEEIFSLLFHPGFSTASSVTNVSGRGVGMDVVQKNLESLRGTISIHSEESKGSLFTIRVPLTLAIIDGFMVGVGDSRFILSMDMIVECLHFNDDLKTESNQYFALRGNLIPYVRLVEYFPTENFNPSARENIIIVQVGERKAGFVVNELFGEYQTVIKPLNRIFKHVKGVSGSSILADGTVALILDVPSLLERSIEKEKLGKL